MKTKPILFSAPMVRAILEGRKTQTRRIVKPQPCIGVSLSERSLRSSQPKQRGNYAFMGIGPSSAPAVEISIKPFAFPGDQLWVKETFSTDFRDHYPCDPIWYRADDSRAFAVEMHSEGGKDFPAIWSPESNVWVPFKWRPSIFMPRWASRITLEITSVRVERLQDISEGDAKAEGVSESSVKSYADTMLVDRPNGFAYRELWESINGKGSWDANPWVWVISFKKL